MQFNKKKIFQLDSTDLKCAKKFQSILIHSSLLDIEKERERERERRKKTFF